MIRRPAQSLRGFTLIELIVVMAIISILASMAVPRFGNSLNYRRVEMAAHRIAADLTFARQRARISATAVQIRFNLALHTYTLNGVMHPDHPTQPYAVALADEPHRVQLRALDLGGDSDLVFDAYGEADSDATITIESGDVQYQITLARGGTQPKVSRTR